MTNTTVQSIQPETEGWLVSANMRSDRFDRVIVALPAPAAAQVIRVASAKLSAELAAMRYSSSITVGVGYWSQCAAISSAGLRIARAAQRRQATAGRKFRS